MTQNVIQQRVELARKGAYPKVYWPYGVWLAGGGRYTTGGRILHFAGRPPPCPV
jgi:hypothetical protein